MNSLTTSKINWTALVMALFGVAVAFDLIPRDAEEPLTQVVLIAGPVLIATFRTWYTGNKE